MASSPLPQDIRGAHSPAASIASIDSSFELDYSLSFNYEPDGQGNLVPTSKGKLGRITASSSPPTPNDSPLSGRESFPPAKRILGTAAESALNSPVRRPSLSRSESAYIVLPTPHADQDAEQDTALQTRRSLQRAASGSAIAISSTAGPSPQSPAIPLPGPPKRTFPRRPTDDVPDQRKKRTTDEHKARIMASEKEQQLNFPDEKENMARGQSHVLSVEEMYGTGSEPQPINNITRTVPPLRTAHQQIVPASARDAARMRQPPSSTALNARGHRLLKGSGVKPGFDKISEVDSAEDDRRRGVHFDSSPSYVTGEDADPGEDGSPIAEHNVLSSSQSGATRTRRSASLSDALAADEHNQGGQSRLQGQARPTARPGTSLGINREASGTSARRVQIDDRQDHKRYQEPERRQPEREHVYASQARQSPPPTHNPTNAVNRASYQGHKRRESDTLKNAQYMSGSPTAVDIPPPSKASPSSISAGNVKHRRSPTAPEPPTTSDVLQHGALSAPTGKTWAPGDREGEGERERKPKSHSAPPLEPPSRPQQLQAVQNGANRTLFVNKKPYIRLDMIGRGGTSRVFRVMNSSTHDIYAIKRVSLEKTDSETMASYMNEIALLKRLEGSSRIIRLLDSELKGGPGGTKGHLLLVMECGEIDLARLLAERQGEALDMVWVAYYWKQMLQAVHVIHEEKIVHSDLKPANFVIVKGQLKLIDFGIANAIANDTTNIQRDHQIGTVNYMSPEAIELPDGMRRLKVGRSSDIWSLGCILYQMVYGFPPFQHLSVLHKMKAIPDVSHVIAFPEYSIPSPPKQGSPSQSAPNMDHLKRRVRPGIIYSMASCLARSPKERITIPELFDHDWLAMREPSPSRPQLALDETIINPHYMKQLIEYGVKLGQQKPEGVSNDWLEYDAERLVAELRKLTFEDASKEQTQKTESEGSTSASS